MVSHLQDDCRYAHLELIQKWEALRRCVHGWPVFVWEASHAASSFTLMQFGRVTPAAAVSATEILFSIMPCSLFWDKAVTAYTTEWADLSILLLCPLVANAFLQQVKWAQGIQYLSWQGFTLGVHHLALCVVMLSSIVATYPGLRDTCVSP